jgi:eukaryotic-like serine/threonine-protein kinase
MHAMAGTGRVIAGRYRLEEPIGRGAMGTVWRAWDEILGREVAVKELRISDGLPPDERAKAYQRTHREARTAARLSHPGVVTVFDVAEEDGRPWIIMELVAARSLDQIISSDGPLPPHRAADAGRMLLAALATAHAAGVLHRDVKPSNVLLADGGRAVLTDFGIATFQGDPKLTQTGMVMGSPGFTAPERIQGNPATPASDLWSLGATLYAAVEGHGPFDQAGGAITTMSAIINSDPPSAPSAAGLGAVIDALLRRNPADRPDAATAARMLGAVGPLAGPAGPGNVFPPFRSRRAKPGSPGGAEAGTPDGPAPGGAMPASPLRSAPGPVGGQTPDRVLGQIPDPVGGQSPGADSGPGSAALPPIPTSVDLPLQPDQTIPVKLPQSLRAAASRATGQPEAGTHGRPSDDTFRFSAAPGRLTGSAPPAPRDEAPFRGTAQPEGAAPSWGAGQPRSAGHAWGGALAGSAGQVWGAAQAGSAGQAWGAAQAGSAGQAWGAAFTGRTGQPADAAPARDATPPGGRSSATQASRRPGRTGLVTLGIVLLVVAVAAGLLVYRAQHRTGLNTAANQTGSSVSSTTSDSPVGAAAGAPSTGPPPAGYRSVTVGAATLGSTSGFTIAVPNTWKFSIRGTAAFAEAPAGGAFLQIDLSPHTYGDMLREARYLAAVTQEQGKFPGYLGLGIRLANVRGTRGAAWQFSWQSPALGRVRALDLVYNASTSAGLQSFALYMSSPNTAWNSNLAAFDEEVRTFRPYP